MISNGIKSTSVVVPVTDEELVTTELNANPRVTTNEAFVCKADDVELEKDHPQSLSINGLSRVEDETNNPEALCTETIVDIAQSEGVGLEFTDDETRQSGPVEKDDPAMDVEDNAMDDEPMETTSSLGLDSKFEADQIGNDESLDEKKGCAEHIPTPKSSSDNEEETRPSDGVVGTVELEHELPQSIDSIRPLEESSTLEMTPSSPPVTKDDGSSSLAAVSEAVEQTQVETIKNDEVKPTPSPQSEECPSPSPALTASKCDDRSNVNVKIEEKADEDSANVVDKDTNIVENILDQVGCIFFRATKSRVFRRISPAPPLSFRFHSTVLK